MTKSWSLRQTPKVGTSYEKVAIFNGLAAILKLAWPQI